jgi:hypothetical protein
VGQFPTSDPMVWNIDEGLFYLFYRLLIILRAYYEYH